MSRIGTHIATIAATAGGLATAFLALSPTAAADPAAPAVPALPGGINVIQQLANAPALASQMLQSAATIFQPAPAASATAATPAAPAAPAGLAGPAPTASASLNLPQPPLSAPMTSAVGTVPGAPANPAAAAALPLLSQLGVPSTLNGLGGLPLPNMGAPAAVPATPAVPGQPALPPNLNPFSALP